MPSPRTIKVGTFNVLNLALPNEPFYNETPYSPALFEQKIRWIAHQLQYMNADIVGFQEIFHLEALQTALQASGLYEQAKILAPPRTGEGPVVACVSRLPVLRHRVYDVFPAKATLSFEGSSLAITKFSRAVLSVDLDLGNGQECTIFVLHLKSKRPIFSEDVDRHDPIEKAKGQVRALLQRAAEATAMRMILMEFLQDRNYPVIVMGDINDGHLAVTSQILTGEPPPPHLPFEHKKDRWDTLLYSVKDLHARRSFGDFYYTHIHNGHYESIDHILVSQEFVAENPHRLGQVSYVAVWNDHLIDDTMSRDRPQPWQSDHGQVVATIELKR